MSDTLRIVLIGQAAFGESVLNALVEKNENVVGVFCPPDKNGRPLDPIKTTAQDHGIAVYQFKRMRDQQAIDALAALEPHLGVMAFVTDIVPLDMINAPTHGTINFHPSLLPLHRGPSSINWPIIQGKTKTGFSVFWPDEGLDTGPILLQKEIAIEPDDTLGTLYFGKIFPAAVQGMTESVDLVRSGNAPRIEQDNTRATYESWCKAEDVVIDWTQSIDTIYNLVRGGDPSPGSNTTFNGASIKFFNASKSNSETDAEPGQVTEVTDEGIVIAASGGSLTVRRVQLSGSKKLSAKDWIDQVTLKRGMKFGT